MEVPVNSFFFGRNGGYDRYLISNLTMNIIESLEAKMAMANWEIAVDVLRKHSEVPLGKRDAKWAENCCVYSRTVHFQVWHNNLSSKIVNSKILPLITKVLTQVIHLEDQAKGEQESRISKARENIELRKLNLSENYVKGKPSKFPSDLNGHL